MSPAVSGDAEFEPNSSLAFDILQLSVEAPSCAQSHRGLRFLFQSEVICCHNNLGYPGPESAPLFVVAYLCTSEPSHFEFELLSPFHLPFWPEAANMTLIQARASAFTRDRSEKMDSSSQNKVTYYLGDDNYFLVFRLSLRASQITNCDDDLSHSQPVYLWHLGNNAPVDSNLG
jgi:hypothetical protein